MHDAIYPGRVSLATKKAGWDSGASLKTAMHEVIFGRSIFRLVGALIVGALCGEVGMEKIEPFFVTPFHVLDRVTVSIVGRL